jgi:hypothetical protein
MLATDPLQGPRIVASVDGSDLQALFVVGDTVHCEIEKKAGLMGALATVIALYYVFDLDYPRPYSMFLATVQTHVMQERYKKDASKGFKTFSKLLNTAMKNIPSETEPQQLDQ